MGDHRCLPRHAREHTLRVLSNKELSNLVQKDNDDSKTKGDENVLYGNALSRQLCSLLSSHYSMTHSCQKGVLEKRHIREKEQECKTREHCGNDPGVPTG